MRCDTVRALFALAFLLQTALMVFMYHDRKALLAGTAPRVQSEPTTLRMLPPKYEHQLHSAASPDHLSAFSRGGRAEPLGDHHDRIALHEETYPEAAAQQDAWADEDMADVPPTQREDEGDDVRAHGEGGRAVGGLHRPRQSKGTEFEWAEERGYDDKRGFKAHADPWVRDCAAGKHSTAKASEQSLRWKDFVVDVGVASVPPFGIVGSSLSDKGVRHILNEAKHTVTRLAGLDLTNELVVVVGAHIGILTIVMAKLFPDVRILALEPLPANAFFLDLNLERHALSSRVTTLHVGLSSHGHPLPFYYNPGNSGASTTFREHHPLEEQFCVPTLSVRRLWTEFLGEERAGLLWVDCEGCEMDVVPALVDLGEVLDVARYLHVEVHPQLGDRLMDTYKAEVEQTERLAAAHDVPPPS